MRYEVQKKTKRTIESVLDLENGKEIIASEFFTKPRDKIFEKRYELESGIQENKPHYICCFCHQAVKIRAAENRIFHFAHLRDSSDCPIKTKSQLSKEEILAFKYHGAKESELHKYLKSCIANALLLNKNSKKGIESVAIEKRYTDSVKFHEWKQPDVSSIYKGKRIIFELQLSTTFISVINARQEFYRKNESYIIWVFNFFEINEENRKLMQSDIYYNNNWNVFEIDELSKQLSIKENDLVLRCNFQEPVIKENAIRYEWRVKYVKLTNLTFCEKTFAVYYYDFKTAENELQKKLTKSCLFDVISVGDYIQILALFSNGYVITESERESIIELYNRNVKNKKQFSKDSMEYRIILAIIFLKLDGVQMRKSLAIDHKMLPTIIDILSLKLDTIIGYKFDKQIQISHKLLDHRKEHMSIYLKAINVYHPELRKEQDPLNKLEVKIHEIKRLQIVQNYNKELIEKIFPELLDMKK